jgi:hypothetical protein
MFLIHSVLQSVVPPPPLRRLCKVSAPSSAWQEESDCSIRKLILKLEHNWNPFLFFKQHVSDAALQLVCSVSVNLTFSLPTVVINSCTAHTSSMQQRTASFPQTLSPHDNPPAGDWEYVTEDGIDSWTPDKVAVPVADTREELKGNVMV